MADGSNTSALLGLVGQGAALATSYVADNDNSSMNPVPLLAQSGMPSVPISQPALSTTPPAAVATSVSLNSKTILIILGICVVGYLLYKR
jgi:hypothetical protein